MQPVSPYTEWMDPTSLSKHIYSPIPCAVLSHRQIHQGLTQHCPSHNCYHALVYTAPGRHPDSSSTDSFSKYTLSLFRRLPIVRKRRFGARSSVVKKDWMQIIAKANPKKSRNSHVLFGGLNSARTKAMQRTKFRFGRIFFKHFWAFLEPHDRRHRTATIE